MKTYKEVADEMNLFGKTRIHYLDYMSIRWPDKEDEERMSLDGYAHEWASRFKRGVEWEASDLDGAAILERIDPDNYLPIRKEYYREES
jgi:hypothetical protein